MLDCFMGSGTTARAAIREGRRVIGIELLEEYAEAARRAIREERNDPSPNEQTNGEDVEEDASNSAVRRRSPAAGVTPA